MQRHEQAASSHVRRVIIGVALLGLAQGAFSQTALAQVPYQAIPLGSLGTDAYATGINASGEVSGGSTLNPPQQHAFLYGTLPGSSQPIIPTAVNSADQVVGSSDLASGDDHAFLYSRATGLMTDLGTLGGTFSYANDISDSGFVTGYSALQGDAGIRAFLYKQNTGMVNLGTLAGGGPSRGSGVNAAGQVVGWAVTSDFSLNAFVYTGGQMWNLNELVDASLPQGVELTEAIAINDQGWIVAEGYNASLDQSEPYLLIPIVN